MPKSKELVSSSSGSDSDEEPKVKKVKKSEKKPDKKPEAKKSDKGATSKTEDEQMFEIGKMRYATVSEFRGKKMVQIREYYYDADGETKPGRKGIAMSEEQWNKLKSLVPKIDKALEEL